MANVPPPRLMGYTDVPAAVNTSLDALDGDPFQRYLLQTPDAQDTVVHRASRSTEFGAFWTGLVNRGFAWTIDNGKAVMGYDPAKDSQHGRDLSDIYDAVVPPMFFYKRWLFSAEQNKRSKEAQEKYKQIVENTLGSGKDSMIYLNIVMTAKEAQGRGYGSTLIRLVTAKADEEARSAWLLSSNVANEGFYNHLGFKTQAEFLLGDDNPTWTEPPVKVALMVREYLVDRKDKV